MSHRLLFLISLSMLSVFSCGCTHAIKTPDRPFVAYPVGEKLDLKVALNITPELTQPEWRLKRMGDTWLIQPGQYLERNTEILARHIFRDVSVIHGGVGGSPDKEAVLTPKTVYVNRTMGANSFGESITSVKVEWNLSHPDGKPVWLETITGEGRGSTGWTDPRKPLQQALEELLMNSYQAVVGSETIKNFIHENAENRSSN